MPDGRPRLYKPQKAAGHPVAVAGRFPAQGCGRARTNGRPPPLGAAHFILIGGSLAETAETPPLLLPPNSAPIGIALAEMAEMAGKEEMEAMAETAATLLAVGCFLMPGL